VNQDVIRELFDTVMAQILPAAAAAGAPVINVVMDPSAKFGFVELRSEELASVGLYHSSQAPGV
jgi:splicing factor U2AF subunit